ncbi:hypothetical protein TNCV_374051 [Trichonephila clavipes]|nr:hypothetical protein TNCV_374051 [Trichonephila clavipes]
MKKKSDGRNQKKVDKNIKKTSYIDKAFHSKKMLEDSPIRSVHYCVWTLYTATYGSTMREMELRYSVESTSSLKVTKMGHGKSALDDNRMEESRFV